MFLTEYQILSMSIRHFFFFFLAGVMWTLHVQTQAIVGWLVAFPNYMRLIFFFECPR